MSKEFAERVENLFRERGLSPNSELPRLGISRSALYNWKNRTAPNSDAVISLANFFDVSTDYLLLGQNDYKRYKTRELSNEEKEILSTYHSLNKSEKEFFKKILSGLSK